MFGKKTRSSPFALLTAALLIGCGESATEPVIDDDDSDDTTVQPPPTPVVAVPRGTPALYLSTTTDASVFNDIIGEVIEASVAQFIQFVPATGEATLIDYNNSVSYAQSRSTLKTFDDDLYILNVSDTGARLRRFNPDDLLRPPPYQPVPTPRNQDSVEQRCFVVQGGDLLYKVAYRRAPFPGLHWADGPLVRVSGFFGGSGSVATLMPGIGGDSPSPGGYVTQACQFNMDWADGVWYDVAERVSNDQLAFYERDPSSGQPTLIGGLSAMGALLAAYDITNFAFDRGDAYFAALDVAAQVVMVARFTPGGGAGQVLSTTSVAGTGAQYVRSLDVDDGNVGFVLTGSGSSDIVALQEAGATNAELFAMGAPVHQLQIIYR